MVFKFRTLQGVTFDLPDLFFRFDGKALRVVCYQSLLLYHSVYRKGKKKNKTAGYIKLLSQKAEDSAAPLLPSCHHCLRCMCEDLPNAKGKPFDCQK